MSFLYKEDEEEEEEKEEEEQKEGSGATPPLCQVNKARACITTWPPPAQGLNLLR